MDQKLPNLDVVLANTQNSDVIVKKVRFKRETLKKLKVMTTNEFFDIDQKPSEFMSEMLDKIINEYFTDYINKLKNES